MNGGYGSVDRDAVRRQLLVQRLTQLETEHVAAVFAVDQIEKGIGHARRELEELESAEAEPR